MRRLLTILITLGMALLALLAITAPAGAVGERAGGTLVDGSGQTIGSVQLEQLAGGVVAVVTFQGTDVIRPGEHGIHFHAVGRCDGPDFMSAGGHYNPTSRQHGFNNPQGPHRGDLENLIVGASTATQSGYRYQTVTDGVTLSSGPATLFDADGTALVIHANADDYVTDPAGNSGGRVACAVLTLTTPGMPSTGAGGMAAPAPWGRAALLGALTLLVTVPAARVARRRAW